MSVIGELICNLVFHGMLDTMGNRKVSLWIRIPCIFLFIFIFGGIILLSFLAGIDTLKEGDRGGWVLIMVGVLVLICIFVMYSDWKRKA